MRIVWTKDEKRALRGCMIDICYVTPMISNKGLFKAAQEEVIPYERRAKVTDQKVFTYKALINEARMEAEKHRQSVVKKPVEPPKEPEPSVRKLDTLGEVFEMFIDAVADRIMDKMIAAKQQVEKIEVKSEEPMGLGRGWLDELEKLSIRSKEAKVRRPTALIVGLNGHQMECIKQTRPEVDFTFVTAEQALSHYTFNKDHTFLMTRFINHSVQNKYRKHPNLHYCNGSVSELKTLLHGIFNRQSVGA